MFLIKQFIYSKLTGRPVRRHRHTDACIVGFQPCRKFRHGRFAFRNLIAFFLSAG